MMIQTPRLCLTPMHDVSADMLLQYYLDNQTHLAPWEPHRQASYYTLDHWQQQVSLSQHAFHEGREYRWVALSSEVGNDDMIIGVSNFTGVIRGAFQACYLGYSVSKAREGQGYMSEILIAGIEYMFDHTGLHRIMANYMPRNKRSGQLLERLGFEQEGYARDYLQIAGCWEDHILTAKVNKSDQGAQ